MIVLTEGKTDDDYIRKSLKLLFPDVCHMFKFFDYHSDAQPERNSSALAKLCNAIVSLNLQEKFIFLFDNDAAGKEGLRKTPAHLPANMKAITLPDLPFAVNYPTIGPDGPSRSDINGRAVAIEFFLGDDVLTRSDGSYCPVEWTGREGGAYQGKLEGDGKQNAQRIFEKAIEESLFNGEPSPGYDWEKMIQLLTHIINTAASLKENGAIPRAVIEHCLFECGMSERRA